MGSQVFNIPRVTVTAADYPAVFKEQFTGNTSATTFTLTGAVLNATFAIGSWDKAKLILTAIGDVTKTNGKALYDSVIPFVRHRISIISINTNGVVTLDYAPLAENFNIYYWYQPRESDKLSSYIRDDVISKVEESEPSLASAIVVDISAFGGNLSGADDTVQKALDTLDNMTLGGSPGDTVVSETSFGLSPVAGSDTAYSRKDHTHGTPAAPTTNFLLVQIFS